jgi:plastocyanin
VNGTIFFILGPVLVVSALVVAIVGLRYKSFPPNGGVLAAVVLWFAVLVGATATFAVLHAADDQQAREAEEAQAATGQPAGATGATTTTSPSSGAATSQGQASTVKLAASATAIAYDTKQLSAKAGQVTIDFDNPAPITHDVCLEAAGGQQVGCSDTISQSTTSLSDSLKPGKYTFFCSVDGHRQAGMQGTLTVNK